MTQIMAKIHAKSFLMSAVHYFPCIGGWIFLKILYAQACTVCPGSSDPPEKIFNIFASENEVYTIFELLRFFRLNIIRLQSKIILGHIKSIG